MSLLPFYKHFQIWKGDIFSYPWQYSTGTSSSSIPNDLTGLSGSLVLVNPNTNVTVATYTDAASPGSSGVFFGGVNNDLTNGIITFVIIGVDTAAINWQVVEYTFTLTGGAVSPVTPLAGTFSIAGTVL